MTEDARYGTCAATALWYVHYICCGRQWSEAQPFPAWEEADQQRKWYVQQPMPGHDRVAIVNRDPVAFGWPS